MLRYLVLLLAFTVCLYAQGGGLDIDKLMPQGKKFFMDVKKFLLFEKPLIFTDDQTSRGRSVVQTRESRCSSVLQVNRVPENPSYLFFQEFPG